MWAINGEAAISNIPTVAGILITAICQLPNRAFKGLRDCHTIWPLLKVQSSFGEEQITAHNSDAVEKQRDFTLARGAARSTMPGRMSSRRARCCRRYLACEP